jgi:hypothetical protein
VLPPLTPPQHAAVEHVTLRARAALPVARARLLAASGVQVPGVQVPAAAALPAALTAGLLRRGRAAVHFHPDRLAGPEVTVAESLLDSGRYVSQFVTGISAGGLTAYAGGDRDRWEEAMFGGAYQRPGVRPEDRPVYGALDLLRHADGPAPRFGSCHLRLRHEVLARVTLSVGDSVTQPIDVGTADELTAVLAGLLEELAAGRLHLGAPELGPAGLVRLLLSPPPESTSAGPDLTGRLGRAMDEYVEAQVHGPVRLADDVEALVADPSFVGTPTGAALEVLAGRFGLALAWHPGFALAVDEVPPEPRGPVVPLLAARLRERFGVDVLEAAAVGAAAADVMRDPGGWQDWASPRDTLQHLKLLWHVLVIAGRPARPPDPLPDPVPDPPPHPPPDPLPDPLES